jgi:hypothetical protein
MSSSVTLTAAQGVTLKALVRGQAEPAASAESARGMSTKLWVADVRETIARAQAGSAAAGVSNFSRRLSPGDLRHNDDLTSPGRHSMSPLGKPILQSEDNRVTRLFQISQCTSPARQLQLASREISQQRLVQPARN